MSNNVIDINAELKEKEAIDAIARYIDSADTAFDINDYNYTGLVEELNKTYAYVRNYGGRPCIFWTDNDAYGNKQLIIQSVEALSTQLAHRRVVLSDKKILPAAKAWVESPNKRTYEGFCFVPGGAETINGHYNTWLGWGVTPKQGCWKKLRTHIYRVACNGSKLKFKYFLRWLAFAVQHPETPPGTILILRGKEGTGKGIIFANMLKIFSRHAVHISDIEQLSGKFNNSLGNACFLFADEIRISQKDKGAVNRLTTEKELTIEPKGRETFQTPNRLHIVMATNEKYVVPATEDSRRYFINTVSDKYASGSQQTTAAERKQYFHAILQEMENGGTEAMFYDLLRMNIKNFYPIFDMPRTEELSEQVTRNLTHAEMFVEVLLSEGILSGQPVSGGRYRTSVTSMRMHIESLEPILRNLSANRISAELKAMGGEKYRTTKGILWTVPELQEARRLWCVHKNYEIEHKFEGDNAVWTIEGNY